MLSILLSKQLLNLNELRYFMLHHFTREGAHFTKRISVLLFLRTFHYFTYNYIGALCYGSPIFKAFFFISEFRMYF